MLAKSCSLFIYYQKGPVGGPGTLLTEGVYESEVGITRPATLDPAYDDHARVFVMRSRWFYWQLPILMLVTIKYS